VTVFAQRENIAQNLHTVSPARPDYANSRHASTWNPFCTQPPTWGNQSLQRLLRTRLIQAKLTVNESSEKYEQEADRVAGQVLRMPAPQNQSAPTWPKSSCTQGENKKITTKSIADQITPLVHRKNEAIAALDVEPEIEDRACSLRGGGAPLPSATRAFFEPRFGHDFSHVRVHADALAGETARSINARAFTIGRDIAFGSGQYAPGTRKGMLLLGHELTHVVQQSVGSDHKLQRAEIAIDNLTITVNLDHLNAVGDGDLNWQINSMINSWLGSNSYSKDLDVLSSDAKRWLMFALNLLMDNNNNIDLVSPSLIVDRLVTYAPQAVHSPFEVDNFIRETLQVSGWLEIGLARGLTTPKRRTQKKIEKIIDPRQAAKQLKTDELKRRLIPALKYFLIGKDPNNWDREGTRSIPAFQLLGDIIVQEARIFFSPYTDATISNIFVQDPTWGGSTHIYGVEDEPITQEDLFFLLLIRAQGVGRNTDPSDSDFNDTNIFLDVSYNDNRQADKEALYKILEEMLDDDEIRNIVERINQVLGRKESTEIGPRIGLATRFDATKYPSACEGHWKGIDTLCHEIVHAMVDPDFDKAVDLEGVKFDLVIREGFTEVLGAQLYNDHVVPKAKDDSGFKSAIEVGVPGAPCKDPAKATIDYGAAGLGAKEIRQIVGDDNFKASYFLGKPYLAGLR
jgi:hypothetical protein